MNLTTATEKAATEKPKHQNSAFKHLMGLHWIMAAFIFSLYVTGVFVVRRLPLLSAWLMPYLHQSLGMLSLLLLIARIFLLLRLVGQKYLKQSPQVNVNWLQTTMLHSSLYFFMLVAPVSGFLLRNFVGLNTTLFGIHVPPVFAFNAAWTAIARSSHFWSSYIFLAFIVLHILAHWKTVRRSMSKGFFLSKILAKADG